MSKRHFTIPPGVAFADLKLSESETGEMSFEWPPISRICEASGIDPVAFRANIEEELSGLVAQWYKHARAAGEPRHPFCEELLAEIAEEDADGGAERDVSDVFDASDRDRLSALRRSDPFANLRERWAIVQAKQPDLASSRLGYVPLVIERRWTVITVAEQQLAYTIGLKYRFGHPELLVAGPGYTPQAQGKILNLLGNYIAIGNRILPGEPVDLKEFGFSLKFAAYSQKVFDRYPCGFLATFESVFDDVKYESGGDLPVIWAELAPVPSQGGKDSKGGSWLGKLFGGGRSR
jgi:hypothetical protein